MTSRKRPLELELAPIHSAIPPATPRYMALQKALGALARIGTGAEGVQGQDMVVRIVAQATIAEQELTSTVTTVPSLHYCLQYVPEVRDCLVPAIMTTAHVCQAQAARLIRTLANLAPLCLLRLFHSSTLILYSPVGRVVYAQAIRCWIARSQTPIPPTLYNMETRDRLGSVCTDTPTGLAARMMGVLLDLCIAPEQPTKYISIATSIFKALVTFGPTAVYQAMESLPDGALARGLQVRFFFLVFFLNNEVLLM